MTKIQKAKTTAAQPLTLGQIATRYGIQLWQVQRIYQRGLVPEADRIGRTRVVQPADLPSVEAALVKGGYIQPSSSGPRAA